MIKSIPLILSLALLVGGGFTVVSLTHSKGPLSNGSENLVALNLQNTESQNSPDESELFLSANGNTNVSPDASIGLTVVQK